MTYLGNQPRSLDTERLGSLQGCLEALDEALARGFLRDESLTYFTLLREIALRVLAECERPISKMVMAIDRVPFDGGV